MCQTAVCPAPTWSCAAPRDRVRPPHDVSTAYVATDFLTPPPLSVAAPSAPWRHEASWETSREMVDKNPPGRHADPHRGCQETYSPRVTSATRDAAFLGVSPEAPDGN